MELQTLLGLIARVQEIGGRLELRDGIMVMVPPSEPYWQEQIRKLLPELKEAKSHLLQYYQGLTTGQTTGAGTAIDHQGRWCETCEAWIFTDEPEIYRLCRIITCPSWRAGLGMEPDWMPKERNQAIWKENEGKKQKKEQDKPLPE